MIIGGFGNQMFQWAGGYARALAAGEPFVVAQCELDRVFDLPPHETAERDLKFRGYFQDQDSLQYTRSQVREWFRFKSAIDAPAFPVVAHVRRGGLRGGGLPGHHREGVRRESVRLAPQCLPASRPPASLRDGDVLLFFSHFCQGVLAFGVSHPPGP